MKNRYLIAAIFTATLGAMAGNNKVAPDLNDVPSHQIIKVIVRWNHSPAPDADEKVAAKGGKKTSDLSFIHAGVYEMKAGSARDLASDPDVRSVHPNRAVYGHAVTMRADFGWGAALNSTTPKLPFDGTGIGIALLDSGVDNHPD